MFGLVAGSINLFGPLEDSFRYGRSQLRSHPASGDIVIVNTDRRSLDELNLAEPTRTQDAAVVDYLFRSGANRVFFDRAFMESTTLAHDQRLIDAFARYPGRVYIGATAEFRQFDGTSIQYLPDPRFAAVARVVALNGWTRPLNLAYRWSTSLPIEGREAQSFSAALANVKVTSKDYLVDFAVDYKTLKQVSYVDVLKQRVGPDTFRGKDIAISPSVRTSGDLHIMPFGYKMPGVIFQVLGAETLKKGLPTNLGWLPALIAAALLILLQSRMIRPTRRIIVSGIAVLLIVPFLLDFVQVVVDVMPALACLTIGGLRLQRLARNTYRDGTRLQRIETMHDPRLAVDVDVFALKIRNFATISAILSPREIEQLLDKAQAMLQATDPDAEFSFDKDTFVWTKAKLPESELNDHLRGLHALFNTSIAVGSQAPDVASSIGVDVDHESPLRGRIESAIQCAEDAAHQGRIFLVSEPRAAEDRVWRTQILSELENAIRQDDVDVYFQPKVSLADERVIGAEALMRWHHPTRGIIDPAQVIAIAEEHNRVDMVTRFVLNRAINQARSAIATNPAFRVAINISALDLRDPMFVPHVEHLLAAYRFPPQNLVLEITETAPIENDELIAQTLVSLKRIGVKLSVDDFGIGHASLHYLRRIPADEVKIDRSFVGAMDQSPDDRALVRSSIEMIHSLGRTAVAEGVETASVVELLRKMGCDAAQGYFYSKAVPMAQLVERLTAATRVA